jgi:hypothetical protein
MRQRSRKAGTEGKCSRKAKWLELSKRATETTAKVAVGLGASWRDAVGYEVIGCTVQG